MSLASEATATLGVDLGVRLDPDRPGPGADESFLLRVWGSAWALLTLPRALCAGLGGGRPVGPQQTGLQMPWRESGSGSLPWISRGPPPPRPLARESGLSCFCLLICPHPLVTMGCRPHQPPHQHENNGQGTQSSAAPQCPGCCWSTFAQPFRILL